MKQAMEQKQKEIDLGKVVEVLKDNKKKIGVVTGVTTLIAIIYCLVATPIFTAKVLINPPKLTDAGSGIGQVLGNFSILSGTAGGILNQKTDTDIAAALLSTTRVRSSVVNKFKLQTYFKSTNFEQANLALASHVKLIPDMKSGFLEIDVSDKDKELATKIANYYTVALGQLISDVALGKTTQKYSFLKTQMLQANYAKQGAESSLNGFIKQHGIIAGQQSQIIAGISTNLQAQLVIAQSQLQSMSMYASPDNPDYKQLQVQIASYVSQLNQLSGQQAGADNVVIPSGLAPELAQQYTNLVRETIMREEIYRILSKQYEAAKLDMLSEEAPVGIQVIDPAVVPYYRSFPKRGKIVMLSFFASIIVASVFFVLKNHKKIIVEV